MNYYCAVYIVQCTRKLRTMNARSHINSVPCMQFTDSIKSLSFSLTNEFFGPIAYIHGTDYGVSVTPFIHGTELMGFGRSDLTEYKNQHKVTFTSQSDFRSY
jgi:hypothetical protein